MAEENTNAGATVETTPATQPAETQASAKPEDIATAFLAALDARTQRAERGVTKSFAEQYGMTQDEINAILAKAKEEKAKSIPPEIKAQIEAKEKALNDRMIATEIKTVGASMGLVDAETALQIMSRDNVKIDEDGAVQGVKEALEKLRESKPYFFATQPTGGTATIGARIDGDNKNISGVEAAFLARNPGIKI